MRKVLTRPVAAACGVVGLLLAGLTYAAVAAETAASAPARAATPSRAAPKPAKYPPEKLVKACEAKVAAVLAEGGKNYKAVARPPFVVAGDVSEADLARYAKWSVVRPAKAMWAAYFRKKPDQVITIYLFAGKKNYDPFAKRDYPGGGRPYFGYYIPTDRRLVMDINTGTGTLVHELTHALIVYDFPNVPTWFNEGLASLHEQCSVKEDTIIGLTNWRLPGLHDAVKRAALRPLKDLVSKRDFYGSRQGVNYAQARYFVMYMQTKGLLEKFYKHFRDNSKSFGADVKAIEHVFGKKIDVVEKEFLAWVKPLRFGR